MRYTTHMHGSWHTAEEGLTHSWVSRVTHIHESHLRITGENACYQSGYHRKGLYCIFANSNILAFTHLASKYFAPLPSEIWRVERATIERGWPSEWRTVNYVVLRRWHVLGSHENKARHSDESWSNGSPQCYTYEWFLSQMYMSHVTHIIESHHHHT